MKALHDTLASAIAEVKRMHTRTGNWAAHNFMANRAWSDLPSSTYATILNAVASDELIPTSDARLAVAMAYQRAGDVILNTGKAHWLICEDVLALAPADDLAAVEALRRERDELRQWQSDMQGHIAHADAYFNAHQAAEAEAARLREALNRE